MFELFIFIISFASTIIHYFSSIFLLWKIKIIAKRTRCINGSPSRNCRLLEEIQCTSKAQGKQSLHIVFGFLCYFSIVFGRLVIFVLHRNSIVWANVCFLVELNAPKANRKEKRNENTYSLFIYWINCISRFFSMCFFLYIGCHSDNYVGYEKFLQQKHDVEEKWWISGQRIDWFKCNNGWRRFKR